VLLLAVLWYRQTDKCTKKTTRDIERDKHVHKLSFFLSAHLSEINPSKAGKSLSSTTRPIG